MQNFHELTHWGQISREMIVLSMGRFEKMPGEDTAARQRHLLLLRASSCTQVVVLIVEQQQQRARWARASHHRDARRISVPVLSTQQLVVFQRLASKHHHRSWTEAGRFMSKQTNPKATRLSMRLVIWSCKCFVRCHTHVVHFARFLVRCHRQREREKFAANTTPAGR